MTVKLEVIYQTRERVFRQNIQTPRSGLKKRGAAEFFNRLRGVWMPDETLFRVFDMASQTFHNSLRNSKQKFTKFYPTRSGIQTTVKVVISFVFSL